MISIEDNSIDELHASQLISVYKNWQVKAQKHRDTWGLHVLDNNEYLSEYELFLCRTQIEEITNRTSKLIQKKCHIDRAIISHWPKLSKQVFHKDMARANTDYTSITFLNEDFEGGKTLVLEDGNVIVTCNPKIGRTLRLDGKKHWHSVTPVEEGARHTLTLWYTFNRAFAIESF